MENVQLHRLSTSNRYYLMHSRKAKFIVVINHPELFHSVIIHKAYPITLYEFIVQLHFCGILPGL